MRHLVIICRGFLDFICYTVAVAVVMSVPSLLLTMKCVFVMFSRTPPTRSYGQSSSSHSVVGMVTDSSGLLVLMLIVEYSVSV